MHAPTVAAAATARVRRDSRIGPGSRCEPPAHCVTAAPREAADSTAMGAEVASAPTGPESCGAWAAKPKAQNTCAELARPALDRADNAAASAPAEQPMASPAPEPARTTATLPARRTPSGDMRHVASDGDAQRRHAPRATKGDDGRAGHYSAPPKKYGRRTNGLPLRPTRRITGGSHSGAKVYRGDLELCGPHQSKGVPYAQNARRRRAERKDGSEQEEA